MGTWQKVLSTANTGPYVVTGASGASPGNPTGTNVTCYNDSTALTQLCLDASGDVFAPVKSATSATAHQWATYVDALGAMHLAQPGFSDLSGTLATAQIAVPQGNGTKVQLSTGSPVSGNCTKFDANGNTVDSGGVCGSNRSESLGAEFSGGGTALSGTFTYCTAVPVSGTISQVYTTADVSGSATIGVKTVARASYIGTAGYSGYTSIVGSAAPSLSSAVSYSDGTLTGWTTTLTAGQILCVQLSSPATVTDVQVRIIF